MRHGRENYLIVVAGINTIINIGSSSLGIKNACEVMEIGKKKKGFDMPASLQAELEKLARGCGAASGVAAPAAECRGRDEAGTAADGSPSGGAAFSEAPEGGAASVSSSGASQPAVHRAAAAKRGSKKPEAGVAAEVNTVKA